MCRSAYLLVKRMAADSLRSTRAYAISGLVSPEIGELAPTSSTTARGWSGPRDAPLLVVDPVIA
jgi:hypothetical protein